jgi:hypothetical protein
MDFKRGMNRKAQEGMTLTTLLAIIVGVVVVVVIILFVTGFFDKLNRGANQLPSDLQAAVTACEMAGENNLKADYCSTFRQVTINGEKQYQTCYGIEKNPATINLIAANKVLKESCGTVDNAEAQFCKAQNLDKNMIVRLSYCSGNYGKTADGKDTVIADWARLQTLGKY